MRMGIFILTVFLIASPANAASLGKAEICRAAIAAIMGHKPSIIQIDKSEEGVEYLSYVRDDGTLWSSRCKLMGNVIIWASDTGRWRTDPADEKITYKLETDRSKITIKQNFGDGSEIIDTYNAADF